MNRRLRRPMPGQPQSTAPSWAADFLAASDPKTPPKALSRLREAYQEAMSQHQQRQAASIIAAIARNPNTPKDELAMLSQSHYGDVSQNPALALLALEDAAWCKECLSRELLKLALPDLYAQAIEEERAKEEARRAAWEAVRVERARLYREQYGEYQEEEEEEDEEEDEEDEPQPGEVDPSRRETTGGDHVHHCPEHKRDWRCQGPLCLVDESFLTPRGEPKACLNSLPIFGGKEEDDGIPW